MQLIIHEVAEQDTRAIYLQLEGSRAMQGDDFLVEIDRGFELISLQPHLFSPAPDAPSRYDLREYYIERFQYRLIYQVKDDHTLVLTIVHAARKPGSWRRRLADVL